MPTDAHSPSVQRDATGRGARVVRLVEGSLVLELDPRLGGRVTEFSLSGRNVLAGPEVVAAGEEDLRNLHGATFWTSPESDWAWPPEPALDRAPYSLDAEPAGGPVLVSGVGEQSGYAVEKRPALSGGWAHLEYTLINRAATRPAAPWEVSRVARAGHIFFPAASEPLPPSTLRASERAGVAWLDLARAPTGDCKLFQDGAEGWLAYVRGDLALIKRFPRVPRAQQAPGEALVEIYLSGRFNYLEIEHQGPYVDLEPGERGAPWRVDWALRRLPPDLSNACDTQPEALVEWVRAQVSNETGSAPGAGPEQEN